ncbi:hypothetical protein [Nonomuraea longicatena]|uniref:Transposase n=1 Tax=Nonomuraea longicatena TaxID=83682 RepID=A0ABP4BIC0_9ACTN
MAIGTGRIAADAIFHTDHGSNHTSHALGRLPTNLQIRRSAARTGVCHTTPWPNRSSPP